MNSIWNNNYSAFKSRFPQLAELLPPPDIAQVAQPTFWKLEQTRNGMITASENGLRLHSAYNPEREAAGGVANEEMQEKSATVFYGFGLGYHVVEWCKLYNSTDATKVDAAATKVDAASTKGAPTAHMVAPTKGPVAGPRAPKKLILIEPDVNHFYAALNVLDWTPVFQVENLVLAIGCPAESVLQLIEDTSKINIGGTGVSDAYFFAIPAFMTHAQEYFAAVQSIINRNKRKNEINAATLKKFGKLWCRNSLRNIEKMRELGCVNDYVISDSLPSQGDEHLPGDRTPSQEDHLPSDRPHTQAPARAPGEHPLSQMPYLLLGAAAYTIEALIN